MTARKVMLLGEIGVGKSSIVQRLVFDKFEATYKPTIGVDVYRYDVPKSDARDGITLIVWDTDGNFGDTIFRHVYMKEASAAVIVSDAARPQTLSHAARLADGFAEAMPGRPVALVVNKIDLLNDPQLLDVPEELSSRSRKIYHTSAKTGANIQSVFHDCADIILRRSI